MKKWIIVGICLSLIVCLSIWLRIVLPYNNVFTNNDVRFPTVDAYTHMRMAEWSYNHYPEVMKYDAYLTYPDGAVIGARPLLGFAIATIAKMTNSSVDIVGAYLPPILAILMLIPIFIIGYKLFGKWAAVIGALFVTTMTGELIGRTMLGTVDHDALEILLQMTALMFLILAIKNNWLYSIGAGAALGIYNLNWTGAPILTMILCAYLVIQSIINQYKKQSNGSLCSIMGIVFAIGLVGYIVPVGFRQFQITYALLFGGAMLLPIAIMILTKILRELKPYWYPVSLVAFVSIALFGIWIIRPVLITMLIGNIVGTFMPQSEGLGMTISEMMPLLYYRGVFSFETAWNYYQMCSVIGLAGLLWLAYKHWKEPVYLLFVVWTTCTIILAVLQRRYGYWSSVSLGMLTGYVIWYICSNISIKHLSRSQKKRNESTINYGIAIIAGLVVTLFVFAPLLQSSSATARNTPYNITSAWMEGLHWLRDNSPSMPETNGQIPEGTDSYGNTPTNSAFKEIAGYGIVSWWDYGYWIVKEAKRPVIVHPGGGWLWFTSQFLLCREQDTYQQEYVEKFKPKYIIIDYQMVTGKFYAIPEIAVSNLSMEQSVKIKQYTIDDVNRTLIMQLYHNNKFNNWELVWQSKQLYNKVSEVKIFELKRGA